MRYGAYRNLLKDILPFIRRAQFRGDIFAASFT